MKMSRPILIWFAALFLLLTAFAMAIGSAMWIDEAADWRAHTYRVINNSERFVYRLSMAEASKRGYFLTGKAEYMSEFESDIDTIDGYLKSLRDLTADQPAQQARIAYMKPLIAEKVAYMKAIMAARQQGEHKKAHALEAGERGKLLMQDISKTMDDFQNHEQYLLEQRTHRLERGMRFLNFGIASSALTAVMIIGLTALRFNRLATSARGRAIFQGTLLDNLDAAVMATSLTGTITSFNRAGEALFEFRTEAVLNQNPMQFFDQSDPELQNFSALVSGAEIGNPTVRECECITQTGKRIPVLLTVGVLSDENGRRLGYLFITRDITERKRAEAKIASTLKELADFKSALDEHAIVATTDASGVITYANDKFCAISKYARHELLGATHRIINSGLHGAAFFQELWHTIGNGQTWNGEIRNRAKDGSFYWVNTTIVPFLDEQGRPAQYIAIRTDITARKEAEMALVAAKSAAELANQTKDSFLAIMSHEIRTPLGGMLGMLELLAYTPLNDDQRDTLRAAHESGRSLLRIVNDILDWSKIEAGKLELEHQPTAISQLVQSVANTYARVASAKSIVLENHIDPRLASAHMTDPLRLSQILNNFVSNALKFTAKGRVEIHAELIERLNLVERVKFSVRDTGIGMDETVSNRLFQNFSQGRADTARIYGGTGLGLVICKRLADLMQGEIQFESVEGKGSVFSFIVSMPVTHAPVEQVQDPHAVPDLTPFYGHVQGEVASNAPSILVVDDHPTNRKLLSVQLALLGLRTDSAESGEAALQRWLHGAFAAVITDCHMPKMDGYELTKEIRRHEQMQKRPRTPIVGWTANALNEEVERCQSAGMDEVLVKPTTLPQLKLSLAKFLIPAPTAEPATPSEAAPLRQIDFAELDKLAPDVADKYALIQEFIEQTQTDMDSLDFARNKQDIATYTRIAHRMKGASRMVGAQELASACLAIENEAKHGRYSNLDSIRMELERLKRLFSQAK